MSESKEAARLPAGKAGAGGARRYKPYPAYKDSGVEWLGEIPAHWEGKRLKNCVQRLESGGTPESDNFDYWTDDELGVPWVAISDMTRSFHVRDTAKRLTERGLRSKRLPVLPAGTLLYSMYASLGKVALLEIDAVVNQAILGLVTRDELVSRDYLRWWLEFMQGHVQLLSSSNTQDNLNADKVRKMPVFVPDSDEQRAIAVFLDRETARIDALVAKKERLIALLEEQRTALITRAVTKGLDPTVPMKDSGVEWLGEIPAHWEVKPNLALFSQRDERGRDDLPILEVSISSGVRVREFSDTKIEQRSDDLSVYKVARAGDVAFNKMRMWQGAVGMTPVPGLVSPDYIVATARAGVEPRYYSALFRTPLYMAEVYRWSHGIVDDRNRLYWEEFKSIRSPVPPTDEQASIAAFLDRETARIDALVAKVREAIERLKELRTALISAAVTGKIDVRDDVSLDGSQITQ